MGELAGAQGNAAVTEGSEPSSAHLRMGSLSGGTILFSAAGWIELAIEGKKAPLATMGMVVCLIASLILLLRGVSGQPMRPRATNHGAIGRVARLGLASALALSVAATVALALGVIITNEPSHAYGSDAASFNHYNAQLVLDAINPYTADGRFWDAIGEFPQAGATPLRRGRYADSRFGPSLEQLVRDVRNELDHPQLRGSEFDPKSLHSYPALAFLVNVPALAVGFPTTLPVMLAALIAFLLAAAWDVSPSQRGALWLALLSNQILVLLTLRGSFDVVALLPALLAWRTFDRKWLSPILLGLACAVKQIAWPLVPFYVIVVWRRDGRRAAVQRLAFTIAAFLIPNAPFILASPRAWANSMLLPMTLPVFPSGIGLVALARAGVLPLFPSVVYSALELAALAALLLWHIRAKRVPRPELALILGLLPFLLAWHSATTYFAAIPVLAAYACIAAAKERASATPTLAHLKNRGHEGQVVAAIAEATPI